VAVELQPRSLSEALHLALLEAQREENQGKTGKVVAARGWQG